MNQIGSPWAFTASVLQKIIKALTASISVFSWLSSAPDSKLETEEKTYKTHELYAFHLAS